MSLVDSSHQQQAKTRYHRGKYSYDSSAQARAYAYEIYYILTITLSFLVLLLCTFGIMALLNKQAGKRITGSCHNHAAAGVALNAAEEYIATLDDPVPEISPLKQILKRELWERTTSDDNGAIHQKMQNFATMEESSLIIGETVVTYDLREDLSKYIKKQVGASKIITEEQANAILAMIHLNTTDLMFLHAQTGQFGTLRNTLTLALCSQKYGNIHFMMIALQVEAHLGWKMITYGERTSWNEAMKASLETKMRRETEKILTVTDRGTPLKDTIYSDPLY